VRFGGESHYFSQETVKDAGAGDGALKTVGAGLSRDSFFSTADRGIKPLLHQAEASFGVSDPPRMKQIPVRDFSLAFWL
jgi:hypothetical protein